MGEVFSLKKGDKSKYYSHVQVDTVNIFKALKIRNVSEEVNFKINQQEYYLYNGCKNYGKNILRRRIINRFGKNLDALGGKMCIGGQVHGMWI